MLKPSTQIWPLAFGLLCAAFLWYLMFRLSPFNFWAEMTFSTIFLGGFALWRRRSPLILRGLGTARAWALGVASALFLYLVFWMGRSLSSWILSSSPREISAIYSYRAQGEPWIILLLLLFVIGPGEEIFWRGFVQSFLSERCGKVRGFLMASALYGLVHVWAGNLMLFVAASTCGFFWGWLYLKEKRLAAVIISHALWDALVFVVLPLQ